MSIADWMTADVYRAVREFEATYPGLDDSSVAERFVKSMSAQQRRDVLTQAIVAMIETMRAFRERERVHRIEQQSGPSWQEREAEVRAEWAANPALAPRTTREYRRWAATTPEGQRETERLTAARTEREAKDRLRQNDPEEYARRYGFGAILQAIEDVRTQTRLEVTAELLAASFALGDGRSVTWGDATVSDHLTRIELLRRQVMGGAETMARHEAAIDLIVSTGADCLNGVREVA